MSRMTQFKDKSASLTIRDGSEFFTLPKNNKDKTDRVKNDEELLIKAEKNISVGLFNYPVLMASDILLYGATYIPVGDDQTQHLEFTRNIAERMNNRFGELFIVPKPVKQQHDFFGKDQGLRIRDLQNPNKKMSKSEDSGKGVIFLSDIPEIAANKIKSAATDSISRIPEHPDYDKQPGISNLLQLLALLARKPLQEIYSVYAGQTQYGPLKDNLANSITDFLKGFQSRMKGIDELNLQSKLEQSEEVMNEVANSTLFRVQKAIGLRSTNG
jgi:tryptophanyl-tRNA synthetase